ncbi:MAG TPA: hypothetical protein VFZ61_24610 [Polyangiales bacterium]
MLKRPLVRQAPNDVHGTFARVSSASGGETPTAGVKVLCLVDGLATAEASRTCVLLWRKSVNETRFQIQREAIEYIVERYPGEASILCVIEPTSEPPPQALREAAAALLTKLGPQLRCVAFVIEGSGFRAAMIRGVLSGIEFLRRSTYPTRYFAEVGRAAAWVASETGGQSMLLADAAHRLRDRLTALDDVETPRFSGPAPRRPNA